MGQTMSQANPGEWPKAAKRRKGKLEHDTEVRLWCTNLNQRLRHWKLVLYTKISNLEIQHYWNIKQSIFLGIKFVKRWFCTCFYCPKDDAAMEFQTLNLQCPLSSLKNRILSPTRAPATLTNHHKQHQLNQTLYSYFGNHKITNLTFNENNLLIFFI